MQRRKYLKNSLNRLLEEAERTPAMGKPTALQRCGDRVKRKEGTGTTALLQPADGTKGAPGRPHHLCRLSPHNPLGREPEWNPGL